MANAVAVGLNIKEALKIADAPSIKLIPRGKGLAIAMEITRRRNEAAKAATQQTPAHNLSTEEVDAEAELFNDEAAPQ